MVAPRRARQLAALVLAAAVVSATACSGGGDDTAETPSNAAAEPVDAETIDEATDEPFDPAVVDERLIPVVTDQIVLGDDVIIATEDGQIPTTTSEPPLEEPDTPPPGETFPPPTTAVPPAPSQSLRLVSLSATHTDTLLALGVGESLVGGVELFDGGFEASEAIALGADLVIVGSEDNDGWVRDQLARASVPYFDATAPDSYEGLEQQILDLAAAVDRAAAGEQLVADMRSDIDAIRASLPSTDGLTYFHEIDPWLTTAAPGTLLDSIYGQLGLTAAAPPPTDGRIYYEVPNDVLVDADPDIVVLTDTECCGATVDNIADRPGWSDMSAIRSGAVVAIDPDLAMNYGLDVVEFLRQVAAAVAVASAN